MTVLRSRSNLLIGTFAALIQFVGLSAAAYGQADLIGARGGLLAPLAPTVHTVPVLPPTLGLPPLATNSLFNGLNAGGSALRRGMVVRRRPDAPGRSWPAVGGHHLPTQAVQIAG